MSGHTRWADIKRERGVESAPVLKAPDLLVEVEKDGDLWFFRIPEWGLFSQAESLADVEPMARDLIATSVGIAIVVDAFDAAEEPERRGD